MIKIEIDSDGTAITHKGRDVANSIQSICVDRQMSDNLLSGAVFATAVARILFSDGDIGNQDITSFINKICKNDSVMAAEVEPVLKMGGDEKCVKITLNMAHRDFGEFCEDFL